MFATFWEGPAMHYCGPKHTLCCLALSLVMAGCGGSNPTTHSSDQTKIPAITAQPSNQTVTVGQTATFSVTATGSATLSYQWQKGTTAIAGATSSSYTTPATTTPDSGSQFNVVVSNAAGSVTSNAATLTVNAAVPPPPMC